MDRQSEPSEEEQFEAYSTVAKAMDGKEVIIRTLDVGGDKDIPYLNIEKKKIILFWATEPLGIAWIIKNCLKSSFVLCFGQLYTEI